MDGPKGKRLTPMHTPVYYKTQVLKQKVVKDLTTCFMFNVYY